MRKKYWLVENKLSGSCQPKPQPTQYMHQLVSRTLEIHLQLVHEADVVAPLGELGVRQQLLDVEVVRGPVVFLSLVHAHVQKPELQLCVDSRSCFFK